MMISDESLTRSFLDFSRKKLIEEFWPRLRASVEQLTDDQVWWRPNGASNSVGNLLLHLDGNVRQWLIASFNGLEDARNRPAEFNEHDHPAGGILLSQLGDTIREAGEVLGRLGAPELAATYHIQGYTVTGLDAVYQVVEHFAMHYGQILYINKMLRSEDLGFYRELNATGRAS